MNKAIFFLVVIVLGHSNLFSQIELSVDGNKSKLSPSMELRMHSGHLVMDSLNLTIRKNGKTDEIILTKTNYLSEDFSVINNRGEEVPYTKPLYYENTQLGELFITCYISNTFTRLVYNSGDSYLEFSSFDGINFTLIQDTGKKISLDAFCETDTDLVSPKSSFKGSNLFGDCIEIYVECGFDSYEEHGNNVQATTDWANGIYADVGAVYDLHGIPISVSQVMVHEEEEGYHNDESCELLQAFADAVQNNYDGRIASYITSAGPTRGKAFQIGGLCSTYNVGDNDCANIGQAPFFYVQGMQIVYDGYPSYSWNVHAVAHELGHLLGSRHTHACVWNGNDTQIDDCGNVQAEGNGTPIEGAACYDSTNPITPDPGEATVMSYCFNLIDLQNGFGTQPGNVIIESFTSANCNTGCLCELELTVIPFCNSEEEDSFFLDVSFTADNGSGDYRITDNDNATSYEVEPAFPNTNYVMGPYPNNASIDIDVVDVQEETCFDLVQDITENCELPCQNPVVSLGSVNCSDANTYSINVTFTGEAGELYNITTNQTTNEYSNVNPGMYAINGVDDESDLVVTVTNSNDANCSDQAFQSSENCDVSCQNPTIGSVSATCGTSTYTLHVFISGTPGSEYDLYASGPGGTYAGADNDPPGITYDIPNIPHDEDVTIFLEDAEFPLECNDSEFYNSPICQDPTITVTWPNSPGQCFDQGENVSISWNSTGVINTVTIEYCQVGGSCVAIIENTENDGSHPWTVANTTGDYYIKIYDPGMTTINDSGNVFEINSNCNGPCDDINVNLLAPSSGATYATDEGISFIWQGQNIGSGSCNIDEYEYELSSTPNFDGAGSIFLSSTSYSGLISVEGSWYWRVRAINVAGDIGPWSSARHVRICNDPTDCEGLPLEFDEIADYPNPFCNGENVTVTAAIHNPNDYPYYGDLRALILSVDANELDDIEVLTDQLIPANQTLTFTFSGGINVSVADDWILGFFETDSDMDSADIEDGNGLNPISIDVDYNCDEPDFTWSYGNTSTGNTDDPNYLPLGITNVFDANEDVYINFEILDALVGGTVSIDIINPSGSTELSDDFFMDPPDPGTIWDWYRGYWVHSFSTPGTYEIEFYFQAIGESNQFQESHSFTILDNAGPEDYTTSDAFVSNLSPEIGEEVYIYCYQNYLGGNSTTNVVTLGYHLSIDQATNSNDIALGFDNSNLSSGNPSDFESITVTIPPVEPGIYYIRFCADYPDDYAEESENNNCTNVQINVQANSSSSQFVVNTSNDTHDEIPGDGNCSDSNGDCSLRAALEESNASSNVNTILFESNITEVNFMLDDIQVIHPVSIDGGFTGTVKVNGNDASNEIEIEADDCSLYGLWFYNFSQEAIYALGVNNFIVGEPDRGCIFTQNADGIYFGGDCNNVEIKSCYFGTDMNFTPGLGNSSRGIDSSSGGTYSNFTVGGNFGSDESNYFCSNAGPGIIFQGSFTGEIIGNYFGTDASLTVQLGNGNGAWSRGGTIGGSEAKKNVFYYGTSDQVKALGLDDTEISFNDFYYNEDAVVLGSTEQYVYRNVFVCNERAIIGQAIDEATISTATIDMITGSCESGATVEVHYFNNDECPEINYCQGSEFIGFAQVTGSSWSISGNFEEGRKIAVVQHNSAQRTSYYSNCATVENQCDLAAVPSSGNTTCGEDNGSIVFNISGGTGTITIMLNGINYTGQSEATELPAGTYELSISDVNGCEESYTVEISTSSQLIADVSTEDTTCGLDNGVIAIDPLNGVEPYMYAINGGSPVSTGFFDGLVSGSYDILVIDAAGCTFSWNASIGDSDEFSFTVDIDHAGCEEDLGALTINPVGGTPPYEYEVDGMTQSTPYFDNLEAGEYLVSAMDVNGCNHSEIITIDSECACYPDLESPHIGQITTENYSTSGGDWTRYTIPVANWSVYPEVLFEEAPQLPPCGANPNASRSWVMIYDEMGAQLNGFCGIGDPADLLDIWFSIAQDQCPPESIYVSIHDRECDLYYVSDYMTLNCLLGCDEILTANFDNGWAGWIDGGSDCRRSLNDEAFANSAPRCIRLRDDSPSSIVTSPVLDLSTKSSIAISFTYVTASMDNASEGFVLEYSTDGINYVQIEDYYLDTDFENDVREFVNVSLESTFNDQTTIRFRSMGSSNDDFVYIDDFQLHGCGFTGGCVVENYHEFDSGWSIWNDGGSDCRRSLHDAAYAYSGSRCVRLRDDSESSVVTTGILDGSGFNQANVSFTYITASMDPGEGFALELSLDGGATYSEEAYWELANDFTNDVREFVNVEISTDMTSLTQFRFKCLGSNNSDFVYIDDVEIEFCGEAQIAEQGDMVDHRNIHGDLDVRIYPNPVLVTGVIQFELISPESQVNVEIIDLYGNRLMSKMVARSQFQRFSYPSDNMGEGTYFVRVTEKNRSLLKKIIVIK